MATFTVSDGTEIRYERRGEGPPILVCQGGPNNICDTLIADLAPLEQTHTLIFHDYRGSGQSGIAPPQSYRFDRLADDLDELRRFLGYDEISVLAHSMGGFVALEYVLRYPDTCVRLVLVGTTPCGASLPMAVPVVRALGVLRTVKVAAMIARFLVLWSWRNPSPERTRAMDAPMSVTQEARRELRAKVAAAHPLRPRSDNAPHLMKAISSIDRRTDLRRVRCPVLVLYGSRDAVMVAGGRMLEAGLPHAQIHVLPDVGHEPFVEAPDEAFAALRDFART